ncbi:DUF4893 domain-containing protein [Hephaestia sp. GCM10023244]|uniref:DUF4893 domain-containing protein n=1 Tax=unclassified Hephaestia TaxID=2631281 RepID=UPI00207718FC|nr:DUF4893 domain-containing protein [Hephaestia sp. MAHUQ-44]MCM8731076.1 DUF4893 domain-containing protein [Hephaestia sp. MAHUQ-44]
MRWLVFATVLPWALAACATTPHATVSLDTETLTPAEQAWRDTIVPSDQALIEDLPSIWTHVLTTAKKRSGKAIDAEGPLLQADAALDHPALPPGSYWCRVVRIGSIAGRKQIESFAPKFCYIRDEEKGLSFTKQSGSDLPAGYLYADGTQRYVFLGARQDAPGDVSLGYGIDHDRDVAGVVERVGAFRWRLVAPRDGGKGIDVYELTPVPADLQPS